MGVSRSPWATVDDRVAIFRLGGPRAEVAYIMDASEVSTDITDVDLRVAWLDDDDLDVGLSPVE